MEPDTKTTKLHSTLCFAYFVCYLRVAKYAKTYFEPKNLYIDI